MLFPKEKKNWGAATTFWILRNNHLVLIRSLVIFCLKLFLGFENFKVIIKYAVSLLILSMATAKLFRRGVDTHFVNFSTSYLFNFLCSGFFPHHFTETALCNVTVNFSPNSGYAFQDPLYTIWCFRSISPWYFLFLSLLWLSLMPFFCWDFCHLKTKPIFVT